MCAIWLCASSLDWAEPMMKLLLHVTCSCISHAYVLLFNIFDIFKNVWNFSDCLSFSPSLLFTLVVSTAHRRKSTPTRNPLHFGASSSSDPTLSHIQFCDDNAFKAFLENFSRRGIHSERQVILLDFADTDMGVIVWRPNHLSSHADPGVLLQHAWDWSVSNSFLHSRSRYAHSYHTAASYRCASGS